MNKQRRDTIDSIISDLEAIKERIEQVASEEREYYDNMPENMQSGDKGQAASDAADALEQALSDVESAIDNTTNSLSN